MKVNYDWVKDQFAKARVKINVGKKVLELLEVWDGNKLPKEDAQKVFEVFSKVALGHALVDETPGKWVQVMPGFIKVGDKIRIKADAFDGELGAIHNGREGVVVALRSGDIIIKTNDEQLPVIDGGHYTASKLEKLVRQ